MPSYPVAFLALLAGSALAQVSLIVPGADPQPLSADILGVDDKGHTTYAVHQGILTDDTEGGLPGTATLVEGSDYASWTYVPPGGSFTMGVECSLSGNVAVCSGKDENGAAATATETETPILVQIGSTLNPAATVTPASSATSSPSGMTTSISKTQSQSATTSKQTTSAPQSTSNSASSIAHWGVSGLVLSLLTVLGASQL